MREFDIRRTQFVVADLLEWQRRGNLDLAPSFQRRSVWKPGAKSYFLDTVIRGLPAPIIYLRQRVDLRNQQSVREVVDGQQRLRSLFAFIDPASLDDFDPRRDAFTVSALHNKEAANRPFEKLPDRIKKRVLEYEFSTHVLPASIEDREVLEIFARLNATGVKLNHQELRNAAWFGAMKTLIYRLALEQLERWRGWGVFTDDQISRMKEVELVSDLVLNMIFGLTGKAQSKLDDLYEEYDIEVPFEAELERRFRRIMDELDDLVGRELADTVFASEVFFFSLFVFVYDLMYGLGSGVSAPVVPAKPSSGLRTCILDVGRQFETQQVPAHVLDAVRRASADLGRRKTRLEYLRSQFYA